MKQYLADLPTITLSSGLSLLAMFVAGGLAAIVGFTTESTGWVFLTYFASQFLIAGVLLSVVGKWLWL